MKSNYPVFSKLLVNKILSQTNENTDPGKKSTWPAFCNFIIACLLIASPFMGNCGVLYHVAANGGSGSFNGTSWANATNLLHAVSVSNITDTIWVQQGTYYPGGVLVPQCNLYGGFVGNETSLSQRSTNAALTVINGGE